MNEINADRDAIFGPSDPSLESQDISQLAKTYSEAQAQDLESIESNSSESAAAAPPAWNKEEAYAEREALFQFTFKKRTHGLTIPPPIHPRFHIINICYTTYLTSYSFKQTTTYNKHGRRGQKTPTRRIAKARCTVTFPPEVLSTFSFKPQTKDMIGPKRPIFEIARLAGIMGAKKTSDLIPLCHALPLHRVHVEIELVGNRAVVKCECWVTHKTGVEMEALTGASIAALTIYDMVKAVNHRVEISQTVLVSKSGGKSDFVQKE
ncbi:hypothetical protein ACHAW6_012221 [Cyclotella cf. meneghiniana]